MDTSNTAGFKDVNSTVGTQEYQYDSNGNMTSDTNKGITTIAYNYLNLPEQVTLDNGDIIHYTYDAAGIKHAKTVDDGSLETTAYVGGFQYLNGDLKFLQHDEGRALKSSTTWNYEYNLTDHLGNVRVSVNESGDVVQRDGYHPFWGVFNSSATSPKNLYKFNGMEEQPEIESYLTDFRTYDPWLGRWGQVDPKANEFHSPYSAFGNNPLLYVDPLGDTIRVYFFDQAENPDNKRVYTADVYVEDHVGNVTGPVDGSTFPNNDAVHNTVNAGTHEFNTESGHDGGTEQALNVVNGDEERVAPGTDPNDNDVEMTVVNVHSGVSPEDDPAGLNRQNRGSAGCPTVCPSGASTVFDAVGLPSGSATGDVSGLLILHRGTGAASTQDRNRIENTVRMQNIIRSPVPAGSDNTGRVVVPRPIIKR